MSQRQSTVGGAVDAINLNTRELERQLRRTRRALRMCLRQMERGRPSLPEHGDQWDRAILEGERVSA